MTRNKIKYRELIFVCLLVLIFSGFEKSSEALLNIETAVMSQDYKKAKKLAQEFIRQGTDKKKVDEARYYLGLTYLRLGEYKEARVIFNNLKKKSHVPKLQEKVYLGLFDAFYLEEKYKDAYAAITNLLKKSPQSDSLSLIYLKAARVSLKLASWDEARKYLKKIAVKFPNSLESFSAKQLLDEKQFFAVQVGSFTDRVRAEKLVKELKRKGKYAYIVETVFKDGQKFYRVRVGQLASLSSAQKLKSQLSKEGYPTSIYP